MYDTQTIIMYIATLVGFSLMGIMIVEWFDKKFELVVENIEKRFKPLKTN